MKKKESFVKDVGNIIGNGIGLASSAIMVVSMYKIIKDGKVVYIEPNPYLRLLELGVSIGGVGYFVYKLYKIASKY